MMKKPIDVLALLTMLLPMLAALILMMLLAGCSPKAGIGIEAACSQWQTIQASRFDTFITVQDIYENNVKREAFCDGV
jgi:hypothetical protein